MAKPAFPWTRIARNFSGSTQWLDSSLQTARWIREQRASMRWAIAGALIGCLGGVMIFAPAAWLAAGVNAATGGRIQLAQAQGTVWSGSALTVLTAGAGSRDAKMLPDRLSWRMHLKGMGLQIDLQQVCCLNQTVSLGIHPGFGQVRIDVLSQSRWLGQWPATLLSGLGTPWNTLDLGGVVRVAARDLALEWVQGRVLIHGQAEVKLMNVSSRLTTLEQLGSYTLNITNDPEKPGNPLLTLSTDNGALQLTGQGSVSDKGLYFRGEATAAEGQQTVLNNLLNIIGRRDGARSVISIG